MISLIWQEAAGGGKPDTSWAMWFFVNTPINQLPEIPIPDRAAAWPIFLREIWK